MLEKIQVAEIQLQSLPHDGLQYKCPPSAILNNRSTLEHVEELTNTVIKTTRATQGNRVTKVRSLAIKYVLYYQINFFLATSILHRSGPQ
jgi:hypothetical protein